MAQETRRQEEGCTSRQRHDLPASAGIALSTHEMFMAHEMLMARKALLM
jgi:hypothetical protein